MHFFLSLSLAPSYFNELIKNEIFSNLHVYPVLVDNVELGGKLYVIHRYIDDDDHHLLFVVEFYSKTSKQTINELRISFTM